MTRIIIFLLMINILSVLQCFSQQWADAVSKYEKYLAARKYDSALVWAEESAALARGLAGEKNLHYCGLLRNLATAHFYLGNYKKAQYFILKEALTRESLKATNDAGYIDCLDAASVICRHAGNYEEALSQLKKAEPKALKLYGQFSARYARILECFAGVYHDYGFSAGDDVYIRQEERYLRQAGDIYRQHTGLEAEALVIKNLADLAAWYNNIGNSPRAEALMQEVIEYCRKNTGPESPAYASALNNIGVIYYGSGNYKRAEKSFIEALSVLKNSEEKTELETATTLNNLGALYHRMGNFTFAGRLLEEARDLFLNLSRNESPDYSLVLNNIASILISKEYYESTEKKNPQNLIDAGKLLNQSESLFNLNCTAPHPFHHTIISNMAIWYNLTCDKVKSALLLKDLTYDANLTMRAVSMTNKMSISGSLPVNGAPVYGKGIEPVIIPVTVDLMTQVAASNAEMTYGGENDAVTTALIRLTLGRAERMKKEVGEYHPAYATLLKSLIVSYASVDDMKREEELTLEYMRVINQKTLQDFSYLSENEKEMYYQTRLPEIHSFLTYALMRKRTNPAITTHAYNNVLLSKGLMLKSSTAMRQAILNSNNPELLRKFDEWIALKKEISRLYATPVEMRDKDLTSLESMANELERTLVSESQDFSDYQKALQVTWEDVKKDLKPGEAAIEFADFRKREKDGGNDVFYCALILRYNSQWPEMIKLFTEDQLKEAIERHSYTPYIIGQIYGTLKKPEDKLYNLIWKPLEQYLEGINTVYVSPSGLLNKVSFPAISNGKGGYLCDNYLINLKGSSGIKTLSTELIREPRPAALIFGGINYSTENSSEEVWSYLEGTKKEGDIISGILKGANYDVTYLSDNKATETYFKENAGRFNIIHLATHGFFFDDPNRKRFEEAKKNIDFGQISFRGTTRSFGVENFVNNENPLMRSGLVLAGANDVWANTVNTHPEDGVLTAQELTQIDMRKSDLVVLSACETGLGDIRGSEGVYGLQRALKIAGTRFIVMSLWEIPDRETVEFMNIFYNNILKFNNTRLAFQKAREGLRSKYDPFYWAAFVLME